MKNENKKNKVQDVETARAKKYILIVFIYTFIMIAIIVAALLFPKKNKTVLPSRDELSENFSTTLIM